MSRIESSPGLNLMPKLASADMARGLTNAGGDPRAVSVAHDFESVFASMLLKEMRQSLEPGSLFGKDPGDVLGGLFDRFMGEEVTKGQGLGMAPMIREGIERQQARGERIAIATQCAGCPKNYRMTAMLPDHLKTSEQSTGQISAVLAERVTHQLRTEESVLIEILEAVRSLHHSLMYMNADEMSRSLQNEAKALEAAQEAQRRRDVFRAEMGGLLGIPAQDLTLGVLAGKTSGKLQESIVESRRRLTDMSNELNTLNRQNAAMLHQSLNVIRGIFSRLTKSAGMGEAYNADGARENSHVGSLVEWGG